MANRFEGGGGLANGQLISINIGYHLEGMQTYPMDIADLVKSHMPLMVVQNAKMK